MDAGTLHEAIADVCPVISTSVPDPDNRNTWSFIPGQGATQPEIDAGNNVVATIPMDPIPPVTSADFIKRFTDAEYLKLQQEIDATKQQADITLMRAWDILIALPILNPNGPEAQSLKSVLIGHGILTQARADEIFGTGAAQIKGWGLGNGR